LRRSGEAKSIRPKDVLVSSGYCDGRLSRFRGDPTHVVRFVPTWLSEGLAEYYSGYRLDADGKGAIIGRPLAHHVFLLRERYMPLAELIAVDRSSPLYMTLIRSRPQVGRHSTRAADSQTLPG
jgi:hypothetical protein